MTTQTELDRHWMRRALELARRGLGRTAPNPAVGCVLLDAAGRPCGEGWHEYEQKAHAEVAALRASGGRERGGTAYVTLEPCNHTGRTGPCSQALLEAGVRRVVAATVDPNAAVDGGGLGRLRAAGIEVEVGVLQDEARRLNEGFARWIQTRQPFVLMKVAATLDGRIAPAPGRQPQGQPYWITGAESLAAVQMLRGQADAILTGIETVLADNPLLTDRSESCRRRRLLRVVLDSRLRLPLDSKLMESAQGDLLVFTVDSDQSRVRELEQRGVQVVVLEARDGRVPLDGALAELGQREILTVLTECGSRLNSALLGGGFVDRLQIFMAPKLLGGAALPAFGGLEAPLELGRMEFEPYGADLGLTALLRDPWPQG